MSAEQATINKPADQGGQVADKRAEEITPAKPRDPALQRLNRRAQNARRRREKMPYTRASNAVRIPAKEMLSEIKHRQEMRGEDPMFTQFLPEKDLKLYADRGFMVEVDDSGDAWRNESDVAVSCPEELHQRELEQVAALDRAHLRSAAKQAQRAGPEGSKVEVRETIMREGEEPEFRNVSGREQG